VVGSGRIWPDSVGSTGIGSSDFERETRESFANDRENKWGWVGLAGSRQPTPNLDLV
jgi:hypothetical protein